MEEFEARLEQLAQAVDDGLINATLETVQRLEDGLSLEFSLVGEDEQGQAVNERWRVVATGVTE